MLALIAMENSASFKADSIRENRAKALELLNLFTDAEIIKNTFRSQYVGYKTIENVNPNSTTETYFKIRAF
jgi:glucose-6-phosphate 1-dehydrogenase